MFLEVKDIRTQDKIDFSLKGISFHLPQFQTMAIAGATGSGKSTLLKIIAGMESPSSGAVFFQGERVKKVPEEKLIPGHPGIAYLSQHFELRNHYRMEELLSYANVLSEKQAAAIYRICKIDHLLQRKSDQLSGGEKQRLALARLMVAAPKLLLLDEPFSNLDMIHKTLLKKVIQELCQELEITVILVSHDPADLLSIADEIILLKDGLIHQQGNPRQVYLQPNDEYAAMLLGKGNFIPETLVSAYKGFKINNSIFVRPEHLVLTTKMKNNAIPGIVNKISFMGSYYEAEIITEGPILQAILHDPKIAKGDKVYGTLSKDALPKNQQ